MNVALDPLDACQLPGFILLGTFKASCRATETTGEFHYSTGRVSLPFLCIVCRSLEVSEGHCGSNAPPLQDLCILDVSSIVSGGGTCLLVVHTSVTLSISRYGFFAGITRFALLVRWPLDTTTVKEVIFTEGLAGSFHFFLLCPIFSLSISFWCYFSKFRTTWSVFTAPS